MTSICVIILYFGHLPNYFPFFLESAKKNSSIDFVLFTDDPLGTFYSKGISNFKVVKSNLENIRQLINKKMVCNLESLSAYKLCDFKITYGYLFEDLLKKYDFWGFCDIDLIFGDIRKFLNESTIEKFDRLSLFGHFQLFRNVERMNLLFKQFDYKKIGPSLASYATDEVSLTKICEKENIKQFDFRNFICDVDFRNYCFKNAAISSSKREKYFLCFDKGNLYCMNHGKKENILYAHFQKRKFKIETNDLNCFFIYPNVIGNKPPKENKYIKNKFFYSFKMILNNFLRRLKNKMRMGS